MTDITAVAPDGTQLQFPSGTADAVVDKAMKDYVTGGHSSVAAPDTPPQAGSYWNDVKGGAHDVMTGIGATAKVAGQIAGRHGYTNVAGAANTAGDWLNNNAPTDAEAGNTPGQRLVTDIHNRDVSQGASDLGHAAVRTGIATAPGLALGAIPYAGPALAGAYFGATSAGGNAQAVAANNGHQEVTDQDALQSLPATALDVVGGGVLGKAGRIASGVANPVGRAAARVGIDAAAGAGMSAGNQLGTSIGTDKGASVDPTTVAAAGLSQGAVGGAIAGRHLAGEAVQAGANRMMAAGLEPPANIDQAASVSRVNSAVQSRLGQMDASTGRPMSEFQAANNLKSQYSVEIDQAIRQARSNGLSPADASALRELANTARRHTNGISDDPSDLFRSIDGMDLPLDPRSVTRLKENVADLNALSQSSFLNKGIGPLQKAGSLLGKVAGVGGAALSGNPYEIAGAVMGMPLEGKIGGVLGGVGDRMLGLSKPSVVFQNINAQKMLRQAQKNGVEIPRTDGTEPPPGAGEADPETGLPPTPVPVNTPIPAGRGQRLQAAQQTLQVDTPESVRATVAADDAAAPQPAPAQPLEQAQQAVVQGQLQAAQPPTAPRPPWSQYIANGHDALTHDTVTNAVNALVEQGKMHPDEAKGLLANRGGYPSERLLPIQAEALNQAYGKVGTTTKGASQPAQPMRDVDGNDIVSLPSYSSKERASRAVAANIIQVHGDTYLRAVNEMLANGKTPEKRQEIMQNFVETLPKDQQAKAIEVLTPLTPFGKRTNG